MASFAKCALRGVSVFLVQRRRVLAKTATPVALSWSLWFWSSSATETFDPKKTMAEPLTNAEELKNDASTMRSRFEVMCMRIQKELCDALEEIEENHDSLEIGAASTHAAKFIADRWTREDNHGGGITCIMEGGRVFERAGVNISVIHGKLPAAAAGQMRSRGRQLKELPGEEGLPYNVVGISSVIHPRNPNVPTLHFNFRYFEVQEWDENKKRVKSTWWFGGGADLTPYILFEDDAVHFHKTIKEGCDKNGDKSLYPKFKKWCDDYFVVSHRGERRGVGGIFFDDLDAPDPESVFKFVRSCAESVSPSYLPVVRKRKNLGYSYADRQWQLLRRGRYVEFNLVHDRGTKFGLLTPGARIESILMSLPSEAKWKYCHSPEPGSKEDKLLEVLKNPRDWV